MADTGKKQEPANEPAKEPAKEPAPTPAPGPATPAPAPQTTPAPQAVKIENAPEKKEADDDDMPALENIQQPQAKQPAGEEEAKTGRLSSRFALDVLLFILVT